MCPSTVICLEMIVELAHITVSAFAFCTMKWSRIWSPCESAKINFVPTYIGLTLDSILFINL